MGGALSTPHWGSGEDPTKYDQWGYKAGFGLAGAPQYQWSQNYTEGFPDLSAGIKQGLLPVCGQNNDTMQLFGTSVFKLDHNGNKMHMNLPTWQFPEINAETNQTHQGGFNYNPTPSELAPWYPDRTGMNGKGDPYSDPIKGKTKTCNPVTFPNCDMTEMRYKAPVVRRYGGGSEGWSAGYITNDGIAFGANPPEDRQIWVMDRWLKAISDSYAHYAGGHTDPALYEVNTQDTSAYDPCGRPGVIEKLLPLLTAGISVWIFHKFVLGMIPLPMPLAAQSALQGGFFFTGLSLGKYMNAETPEQNQDYRNMAAYSITLAGGFAVASTLANYYSYGDNLQWYGGLVGALAVTFAFQPMIAYTIGPALFGINLVYAVAKFIVGGVSYWICRVANWGLSACIDYDAFPDARRWDFPSIVALMTDKAIAEEGWTREDPRAEFVYRSLLTNPYLSQMVTADADLPGLYGNEHNIPVNPIGEMVQITAGCTNETSTGLPQWFWGNDSPVGMVWKPAQEMSWNGKSESGFSKTSTNQWACQNWGIISCEEPSGDRTAGKCSEPEGYQNPQQRAENFKFRTLMRRWIDGALTAAKDPANLAKMNLIPGLDGREYKEPKETCAKFLQTCQYDLQYGGFDDINERGNYAFDNLTQLLYEVEGGCAGLADEPKLLVNTLFRFPNSSAAWDEIEKWGYGWKHDNGTPASNKIAAAHYLHQGSQDILKAPNQSSSLINWLSPPDERIAALRNLPDPGFKPIPASNADGPISINDKNEQQKMFHAAALRLWNAPDLGTVFEGKGFLARAQAYAAPDDFGIIFATWAMWETYTNGVSSPVEKCSYKPKDVNGAAILLAWQNSPPILPDPAEQDFFMYFAAAMLNKFARPGVGWEVYQWSDSQGGQCFDAKVFISSLLESGKHLSPEREGSATLGPHFMKTQPSGPFLKTLPGNPNPPVSDRPIFKPIEDPNEHLYPTRPAKEQPILKPVQDPNRGMYPTNPIGERPIFKPIEDPNEGLLPTRPVGERPIFKPISDPNKGMFPTRPIDEDPGIRNFEQKVLPFGGLATWVPSMINYYLANSGPQAGAVTPATNAARIFNYELTEQSDAFLSRQQLQSFITDESYGFDTKVKAQFLAIYMYAWTFLNQQGDPADQYFLSSIGNASSLFWGYKTQETNAIQCELYTFYFDDPGFATLATTTTKQTLASLITQYC